MRVTLLTPELTGAFKNGGIGTATSTLAALLKREGHSVSLLLAATSDLPARALRQARLAYRKQGVKLLALPPSRALRSPAQISLGAFKVLHTLPKQDLIIFPDAGGPGFHCMQAKRGCKAFKDTQLAVVMHGPSLWHHLGNGENRKDSKSKKRIQLERGALELADHVVVPSKRMAAWAAEVGWKLPKPVQWLQNPCAPLKRSRRRRGAVRELVFFGRLETRKGLEIFCDAIDALPATTQGRLKTTFLGNYGSVSGESAESWLPRRTKDWHCVKSFIPHFGREQALRYLVERRCAVVLASLTDNLPYAAIECAQLGVPVLASDHPSFRELFSRADYFDRSPKALARAIQAGMRKPPKTPVLRRSPSTANRHWAGWVASLSR